MAKGNEPAPKEDKEPLRDKRQAFDLGDAGNNLEEMQSVLDRLHVEQLQVGQRQPEQTLYDKALLDRLTFDDGSHDTLKATLNGLAWCASCHIISRMADWWTQDKCPHCLEPVFARFAWSDLRRINPTLPEKPPLGQPFLMDEDSGAHS